MIDRLTKDSGTAEVTEEHKSLVKMLNEQNKRTLELLEKQQFENRLLFSKLGRKHQRLYKKK